MKIISLSISWKSLSNLPENIQRKIYLLSSIKNLLEEWLQSSVCAQCSVWRHEETFLVHCQQVNSTSSSTSSSSWATFILVVQTSASSSQVSCFTNYFTVHMIIVMSNYINIFLISADIMKQYTLVNDSHYWISPLLLLLSNWLNNIAWSNMFSWTVIWISAINKSGSDSIFLLCASHWSSQF